MTDFNLWELLEEQKRRNINRLAEEKERLRKMSDHELDEAIKKKAMKP